VFNLLGETIFRKEYKAGELISFDLSNQLSGIYLAEINLEGVLVKHKTILYRK